MYNETLLGKRVEFIILPDEDSDNIINNTTHFGTIVKIHCWNYIEEKVIKNKKEEFEYYRLHEVEYKVLD